MENQKIKSNVPPGALNLNSVLLSKSIFSKGEVNQAADLQMEFSISSKEIENKLLVSEKIKLTSNVAPTFAIEVEMVAEFEKGDNFTISVEDFGNINAAPIIFGSLPTPLMICELKVNVESTPAEPI